MEKHHKVGFHSAAVFYSLLTDSFVREFIVIIFVSLTPSLFPVDTKTLLLSALSINPFAATEVLLRSSLIIILYGYKTTRLGKFPTDTKTTFEICITYIKSLEYLILLQWTLNPAIHFMETK